MSEARYKNPWHNKREPMYGPPEYVTSAQPTEYKGHLIYRRLDSVWDVVKDGVCVTQRAGPNGAKRFIDSLT